LITFTASIADTGAISKTTNVSSVRI